MIRRTLRGWALASHRNASHLMFMTYAESVLHYIPQEKLLHFECGFESETLYTTMIMALHWATSEFMCVGVEKRFHSKKD